MKIIPITTKCITVIKMIKDVKNSMKNENNLRTLKDLSFEAITRKDKKIWALNKEELKQEAIKWVQTLYYQLLLQEL